MFRHDRISLLLLYVLFLVASVFSLLQIKELKVPSSVKSGEVDEIILDCDYEAQNEDGIEVKWFYNGDKDQIYQWIPATKTPGYSMGSLRNNIDATYKATEDKLTMYRALRLIDVSHNLTGSYTCKVSGYTEEATATKNLTIFVPPENGLNLTVIPEELTASCSVSGVFPEPSLSLIIHKGNATDDSAEVEEDTEQENGIYSKAVIISFTNESMISTSEFICEMRIPGTEYTLKETRLFSKDNFSIRPYLNILLLHLSILLMFL